ncbi:class I SAM-dependent methyltransferase [Sphaerisporangium aureirubrum]|uniref:Class I SAM-dependent methyltransferase n=1 Tax=Sphaerisporangium aureirubrum TaxID=1544736 RepID=A0ABW1NV28_9ACTN
MTIFTVARNAMRPAYLPTMAHKVYLRVRHGHDRERKAALGWAGAHAQDLDAWGRRADPALWAESVEFARRLAESAGPKVDQVAAAGVDLGGPGGVELLYFLTRSLRPAVALETGVAAGWSTAAILGAVAANGAGQLYSSDFPLFRISHPERYIGCVVPEELRGSWSLHLKGDRRNLPEILSRVQEVGLSHYDSDKTRGGREYFLRRVKSHTGPRHVLVMDDVQDNLVFREHVARQPAFRVFSYQGKFIGLTGPGLAAVERGGR